MSQSAYSGLTSEEVIKSRSKFGSNKTELTSENAVIEIVKDIVTEPMFILLVAAAVIYFVLGEKAEAIIMLAAIMIVASISFYQERRSHNAVEALKKLSSPLATVCRGSEWIEIKSEELVVDDIIIVEDGDLIPADANVIECHDFTVNESILTGESLPVIKSQVLNENAIFKGTLVLTGYCVAKVTSVGANTSLAKIEKSIESVTAEKTPLQIQISTFVKRMVAFGAVAFLLVWALSYYQSGDILHGLLHGLTLAMSVLPEEIPVAFSAFMALGAYRLLKENVIAKHPYTVEALGAATVICVDKTGTLTQNEMKLAEIYDYATDKLIDYHNGEAQFCKTLEFAMWASEPKPFDPMEESIHEAYGNTAASDSRPEFRLAHEYPISGSPPIMTHIHLDRNGNYIVASKGGLETILYQCTLPLEEKQRMHELAVSIAGKGRRVLGVAEARPDIDKLPESQESFVFEFLGLISFYDPPKDNIENIISSFYDAGIQVKMVTGDYPETARAVADQVSLKNDGRVLSGSDVMKLNDEELLSASENVNIFARMFPDAKMRIINALKKQGEVVAMTGDGVNDGPALKASHIGISMGNKGSELAKSEASLILVDDDLAHMVDAVAMGRKIYENLKKAIQYIISIHIPIILIVTLPLLFFWEFSEIFTPVHVIFLELIMGPTCSIIYENEPIEANSMKRSPRKMTSTFLSMHELSISILQGLAITVACLWLGYDTFSKTNDELLSRTVVFSTLIFSNLFLTLINRSFYYSVLTTLKYKNRLLPLVLVVSLSILFIAIYIQPVSDIFGFRPLGAGYVLLSFAAAFAGTFWMEFWKAKKRSENEI
jgi:Ca2+-transporting ATPase